MNGELEGLEVVGTKMWQGRESLGAPGFHVLCHQKAQSRVHSIRGLEKSQGLGVQVP